MTSLHGLRDFTEGERYLGPSSIFAQIRRLLSGVREASELDGHALSDPTTVVAGFISEVEIQIDSVGANNGQIGMRDRQIRYLLGVAQAAIGTEASARGKWVVNCAEYIGSCVISREFGENQADLSLALRAQDTSLDIAKFSTRKTSGECEVDALVGAFAIALNEGIPPNLESQVRETCFSLQQQYAGGSPKLVVLPSVVEFHWSLNAFSGHNSNA